MQWWSHFFEENWAKYFFGKMNFVKRKATTKSKLIVKNFEEVKYQFLLDIKTVVENNRDTI